MIEGILSKKRCVRVGHAQFFFGHGIDLSVCQCVCVCACASVCARVCIKEGKEEFDGKEGGKKEFDSRIEGGEKGILDRYKFIR